MRPLDLGEIQAPPAAALALIRGPVGRGTFTPFAPVPATWPWAGVPLVCGQEGAKAEVPKAA